MAEIYIRIGLILLAAAFGAGGYAVVLRSTRKDVNGLGRIVRAQNTRIERLGIAVLTFCPPDKREQLAALLLEEEKKRNA